MHVVVDDRELQAGVLECLRSIEGVTIVVRRLPLGDYLVDNRLLFERKTLSDLTVSIVDGRLFNQAWRLASCEYRPVYILEGSTSDLVATGMRREALQGAIITLTVLLNIPLLRSWNQEETARLIQYASEQVHRTVKGGVQRCGYRPKGKRKRQLYILQGLPGIGPERAERLLDTFGSVEAVFGVNADGLCRVEGVGMKIAEKIRNVVSEQRAVYGVG